MVDDEETVLKLLKRSLEKSGYHVIAAVDGEQGLNLYKQNRSKIMLVITDMAMPGMDGPEFIAELRKADPFLKIICTTGYGVPSSPNDLARLGVQACLAKPCNTPTMLETIQKTLTASHV